MIVIDSFLNLLNAAIGRKQDFEQLIQSGDISRVLASMESKAEETAIARREYDPKKHLINRREDKIILDKDGNLKRKIKRWKLPIGYPVFINEIALVFIYGQSSGVWHQRRQTKRSRLSLICCHAHTSTLRSVSASVLQDQRRSLLCSGASSATMTERQTVRSACSQLPKATRSIRSGISTRI